MKKYYVLYKTITNEDGEVIDIQNIMDLKTYNDIEAFTGIDRHNIKRMINNNINNFDTLKTFKNYTIIIDKDVE